MSKALKKIFFTTHHALENTITTILSAQLDGEVKVVQAFGPLTTTHIKKKMYIYTPTTTKCTHTHINKQKTNAAENIKMSKQQPQLQSEALKVWRLGPSTKSVVCTMVAMVSGSLTQTVILVFLPRSTSSNISCASKYNACTTTRYVRKSMALARANKWNTSMNINRMIFSFCTVVSKQGLEGGGWG